MKKKIILIVVILLLIVGGVLLYLYMTDAKQEKILVEELDKIDQLDFSEGDIDMEIKSNGKYANVEKAMKNYYKEYADATKRVISVMNDEKLANVLSVENYKKDGPDFIETKKIIEDLKKEFNENSQKLIDLTSKEGVEKYIEEENLDDSYYKELYNVMMVGNDGEQALEEAQAELYDNKEVINQLYDTQEKIINFLVENKANWSIENDELKFKNDELSNKYEELIDSLPEE